MVLPKTGLPPLSRCLVGAALLATLSLGSSEAHAQTATPIAAGGGIPGSNLLVPATPFTWGAADDLGPVQVPLPGQFGWFVLEGRGFEARVVPSVSGDPTIEATFLPGASGHPTKAERITFQFPYDPTAIPGSGALVIAFHSFGVSEKQIWLNTDLPKICKERGWNLLTPYGLIDTHYGNVESQESLDKVLNTAADFFTWDPKRVYAVGFSMGGGAALSYSFRHLSGRDLEIAAVVNHTGTQDLIGTYNSGSTLLKNLMADDDHFGAPPVGMNNQFAYKRVSPTIFSGGAVDPAQSAVVNLKHLPIYNFVNLNDPQQQLMNENLAMSSYLSSLGANVKQVTVSAGLIHNWSTLDLDDAMNWVSGFSLPAAPQSATVFADTESVYFGTTVRAKPALRVAFYDFSADTPTNSFSVQNTLDLDTLALNLPDLGLDPQLALGGSWSSQQALGETLVLQGYLLPPSQVLMNGVVSSTWSHDASKHELTIPIQPGPTSGILLITP